MRRWKAGVVVLWVVAHTAAGDLAVSFQPVADSFLRADAPASNYGGAGALSVSGPAAVNGNGVANGVFNALMRFDVASLVTAADAAYGPGQWFITSATLSLTEVAAPNNALFNRGVGGFSVSWLVDDAWVEGTGNPAAPSATGVAYQDLAGLLDPLSDEQLGTYTNAGANGMVEYGLFLAPSFVSDALTGGLMTLHLVPEDDAIGFTFNSRSFGMAANRPLLSFEVVPEPSSLLLMAMALGGLRLRRRFPE